MIIDPFEGAKLRLNRANEFIQEFEASRERLYGGDHWTVDIEPDTEKSQWVHKLRIGKGLGKRDKVLVADALNNLCTALDLSIAACARLNGTKFRKEINFPFTSKKEAFEGQLKGLSKHVPPEVIAFLRTLRPYPLGDEQLYALKSYRNLNEHWAITPTQTKTDAAVVNWPDGRQQFVLVPRSDHGVDEIELFRTDDRTTDYCVSIVTSLNLEVSPELGTNYSFSLLDQANPARDVTAIVEKIERRCKDAGLV